MHLVDPFREERVGQFAHRSACSAQLSVAGQLLEALLRTILYVDFADGKRILEKSLLPPPNVNELVRIPAGRQR